MWLAFYVFVSGPDYIQWKLATSTVLALSFVPYALVWRAAQAIPTAHRFRNSVAVVVALGMLGANVAAGAPYLAQSKPLMQGKAALRKLADIDEANLYKGIRLNIDTDYTGYMVARQFVNRTPLVLLSENLPDEHIKAAQRSADVPLLTHRCSLSAESFTSIGDAYCITNGLRMRRSYTVVVSSTAPQIVTLVGGQGLEPWGAWGTATTTFKVPTDPYWNSARLTFAGAPFTSPCASQQRVRWALDTGETGETTVAGESVVVVTAPEQALKGRATLSIAFTFPDAHSPKSCNVSDDTRELGFGFRKVTVEGDPGSPAPDND